MTTETVRDLAGVKQFRYDAFISYRHVDPDRRWAKWLHSALESYRVPRKLARAKGLAPRIGRVFRDEEELPAADNLNAEIESALSQSRFLLVVCSPRATRSRWVNREIERFREMGRHGHILALLIEGEPGNAFPQALREIRHTVIDRGGSSEERIEEVEPLAADVRETRHESGRYLRRMAKLRVLSCLLGVKFDDLRRRDQERRARQMACLGTVLLALLCAMGALAVYAFHQRDAAVRDRRLAEQRQQEAIAQRRRAEVQLAQGTVLQGDLLGSAGRWAEARDKYAGADALFSQNAASPLPAQLGLWDASAHVSVPLATFSGHTGFVRAVAISPDGRRALSGGDDKILRLWDLPDGKLLASLPGHTGTVRAVTFLPDGKRALSAADDKVVRLWDLATGHELHAFTGHEAAVNALALLDAGKQFLSGDAAGKVRAWNIADGSAAPGFDAGAPVACLAVPVDGRQVLCGGSDGKCRVFDRTEQHIVRIFDASRLPLTSVAFVPGGKSVLCCGYEDECWVFNLDGSAAGAAAKPAHTFKDPASRFCCATMSPDGRTLLTGNWQGRLESFDFKTGRVRRTFVGHAPGLVTQVAISPDGRIAVSASTDNSVKVWDMGIGAALRSWGYGAAITGVGFSRDGRIAFTATGSGRMELWDIASEQTLYALRIPDAAILSAVLCPDGRRVVLAGIFASGANLLARFDLTGVSPTLHMEGHEGMITAVAVSPDGTTALTGSSDTTARVWNLATGRERYSLPHGRQVSAAAFSADGRRALTVTADRLRLWDTADWRELRTLGTTPTEFTSAWEAAAFSPDGKRVLAGTQAGALKLIDTHTGTESRTFSGSHTGTVGRIAFSPDGRLAASGSDDHTVRLWDVESGTELRILSGHEASVREVAFSPDGQSLLTGGLDRSLKLWNFASAGVEAQTRAALSAARDAAAKRPADPAAASALSAVLGREYALRGLDEWAVTELEQARAGGDAVSPLLLGRCDWRLGRLQPARVELQKALDQKEAPAQYLATCLKRLAPPSTATTAPSTAPATAP